MRVYKIVLTGGPSGGKTKIIERLTAFLKELKYNVILIPETAREVISSGIKPNPNDRNYTLWFQNIILNYQKLKENSAEEYALTKNEDVIILYDRAIPDNFAYLDSYGDYKKLLDKNNLSELQVVDKYDLIINLSSLANFIKYKYENDSERTEDRNLSKILDFKTSTAYLLSRNLRIVYPSENIEEKYKIVEKYIIELLNHRENREIIKYEVDINNSELSIYDSENSRTLYRTDYYLANDLNDKEYILTRRVYNGEVNYTLTKSIENENISTIFESKVISNNEYNALIKQYRIIKKIKKQEITFIYDYKRYKLVLDEDYNCTLELENTNFLTDIKIPSNIKLTNNLVKAKKYDSI